MALFRDLGVRPRDSLCDVQEYVSAESLAFLDLAKNDHFGLVNSALFIPRLGMEAR
jgi:hypothetical protein